MSERELFIVEGESAASTIRQAMHKPTQAVLAIKGKMINSVKASHFKVINNAVCQHLVNVLECGWEQECNPKHLAFSRVTILTDPDADGAHARVLLIHFFANFLRPLIESGLVFVITPPIYRINADRADVVQYAWSQHEMEQIKSEHQQQNVQSAVEITRFKGIAQLTLSECAELLLHTKESHRVRLSVDEAMEEEMS